jgi:8-oxo-dGTP pyrophosphatase MutT (NUDIX family)
MYVFPGGTVDPGDADLPAGWSGPSSDAWAEILGCPAELAGSVVCAAVRETFEECGVLLASSAADPDTLVETSGDGWEADRLALARHETTLADLFARLDLVLRADLLHPWTHWVTPEFEPRRYDTWFFIAQMPERGRARDVSGEADLSVWRRPLDALADYRTGGIDMMPPTLVTLREIALHRETAGVLAAAEARVPLPAPMTARLRPRAHEDDPIDLIWPVEDPFGAEPFPLDRPVHAARTVVDDPRVPVDAVERSALRRASSEP